MFNTLITFLLVFCICCTNKCFALTIKGYEKDKTQAIYILDAHDTVFSGSEEAATKYISTNYSSMSRLVQVLIETEQRLYSIYINVDELCSDCVIKITGVESYRHGAGVFSYSVSGLNETLSSLGVYLKKSTHRRSCAK